MTVICGDRVVHDQLAGEGILRLQPQCTLGADKFHLISRISLANESNEMIIPEIHIDSWDYHSPSTPPPHEFEGTTGNGETINELKRALNITRSHAHLSHYNYHDVHHYTLSYLIVVCLIIYFTFKYCIHKNRIVSMPRIESPNEDISPARRMSTLST